MGDSDSESAGSDSPRKSHYGRYRAPSVDATGVVLSCDVPSCVDDWIKEPLVAEKMDVYLLHWDKTTQSGPQIYDTTLVKPDDPAEIFRHAADCVIHYHDTTLTPLQFEHEYGMPPRTRSEEILRLRRAILTQYLTEIDMDAKKKKALKDNEMWDRGVVPTAHRNPPMNPSERLKYITSLWPTNMPNFPDADDSLKYYGFQVGIFLENDEGKDGSKSDGDDDADDFLPPSNPTLTAKEENWVQCDKCQKWRKLPDSVDVSELPPTWYCRMNKWSRKFNKCSAAEEVTVAPSLKETDVKTIRERKFVHQFAQRLKRMEKALSELKYADMKEDAGARQVVTCNECGKKRPLLGGMDPRKIQQPFVCWMNRWDEIHASCSAPQGALLDRVTTITETSAAAAEKKAAHKTKKKDKSGATTTSSNTGNTTKSSKRKTEDASSSAPPAPPLYSSSEDESKVRKRRRDDRKKR
ncbi:Aste57867_234 [Aphanomyces stellatus]|uniref:Aste57867_234 protein n=1 Tax=Aphanomyces stellatus TaxID=120398 RepID=A0A485K2J2_9STRA|nr:hypothetical protein As57867_000234 [Aphanomyces stellatus]VFT77460.1 Aste57867_234 [Aphanomyces stellatus]